MDKIIFLHIETSGDVFSICLSDKNIVIDTIEVFDKNKHSELIASEVNNILKRNNITLREIKAISISKGPGSYTGLRIGTSFVKAICYALNIPLITLSTLKILANSFLLKNSVDNDEYLCPIIDAKKMDVYFALFNKNLEYLINDKDGTIDESFFSNFSDKKVFFFGSGSYKIDFFLKNKKNMIIVRNVYQTSKAMPNLAWEEYTNSNFTDIKKFEPFYIREFIPNLFKK